jgi:hypothetical protein
MLPCPPDSDAARQVRALPSRTRPGTVLATGVLIVLALSACVANEKASPASPAGETGPPTTTAGGSDSSNRDGQNNSCSAPPSTPRGSCGGCSVNCGDKEAICVAGEEWPSGGPSCQKTAMCACR